VGTVSGLYRISIRKQDGVQHEEFPSEGDYRRRLRDLEEEGATFTHRGPGGWGAAWKMSPEEQSFWELIPRRKPGEPRRSYRLSDLRRGKVVPVEDENTNSSGGADRK
jgi:hypothetical protein